MTREQNRTWCCACTARQGRVEWECGCRGDADPRALSEQELIAEVPPIPVNGARVSCDGGETLDLVPREEARATCMHS